MSQKPNKASKSIAEYEREISALKTEINDLKMKLEHMNEILEQKSIIIQSGNTSIEIPGNANPETVRAAVSFLKQP